MSTTNQIKYVSANPLRKIFLRPFQRRFLDLVASVNPTDILEVGAGEGYLLDQIHRRLPSVRMVGLDVDSSIVAEGRRVFPHLELRQGDAYHLNEPDHSWDVIIASEVLEHLDRPEDGLRELARVAKRQVIVSVPWEPWFRLMNLARGQHITRFGNHPEHVNNWTQKSFIDFIGRQLKIERVIPSLPWTIVLARV